MTHFEYLESVGQTNIFDFMPVKTERKRKSFVEGDKVRIQFYDDELEAIQICHPQLLEVGVIVGKKLDFYMVQIGDTVTYVECSKLLLI